MRDYAWNETVINYYVLINYQLVRSWDYGENEEGVGKGEGYADYSS